MQNPTAERGSARIARDILSEPHVRGRRVSVRGVVRSVVVDVVEILVDLARSLGLL